MPSLTGSVTVPVLGTVSKRNAAIYGGVALAVVGVAVYRHNRAAAIPANVDTNGDINEATGYDYGSESDAAALSGYGTAGGQYGSAFGSGYSGSGAASDSVDDTTTNTRILNNAQWTQAAVDFLSGTVGVDTPIVSEAMGKYIAGGNVTAAQKSLIEQAIAAVGQPPQSGVTGFPPSIRYVAAPAARTLRAPAVRIKSDSKYTYLYWTTVSNANQYQVFASDTGLASDSRTRRSIRFTRLTKPRQIWVVAKNVGGGYSDSPKSQVLTVPALPPKPKAAPKKKK